MEGTCIVLIFFSHYLFSVQYLINNEYLMAYKVIKIVSFRKLMWRKACISNIKKLCKYRRSVCRGDTEYLL